MARAKTSYHHGDLRVALVEHALALVERGGTEAFSLREAARGVGVSANAAYRHFEDKGALLSAVAAEGFARLGARMQAASEAVARRGTPATIAIRRLQAVGRAYVEVALEHPELFRLMFGPSGIPSLQVGATPASPYRQLGAALDGLVAAGVLPATRRPGAELKAWVAVHGFAALTLDEATGPATAAGTAAGLAAVLDFVVTGLCGAGPPP